MDLLAQARRINARRAATLPPRVPDPAGGEGQPNRAYYRAVANLLPIGAL